MRIPVTITFDPISGHFSMPVQSEVEALADAIYDDHSCIYFGAVRLSESVALAWNGDEKHWEFVSYEALRRRRRESTP